MAEYLLSAKTPEGREITERLEVSSADEAVGIMRARGYLDIVLHTGDVEALYTRQSAVAEYLSPREYVALRNFGRGPLGTVRHIGFVIWKLYRRSWKATVLGLALLVLCWAMARQSAFLPWRWLEILLLLALLLPFFVAPIAEIFNPSRRYIRIIEELAWGRWEGVIRLLPTVPSAISREHVAGLEAKALAGLGRLDEGLAIYEPFGDGRCIPQWKYWATMCSIYAAARQIEPLVAAMEKSGQLAPENSTVQLDLAMTVLRYRHDAPRAAKLIQQAKSHAISDLTVPFVHLAEGLLALERGDAFNAIASLEKALAGQAAKRRMNGLTSRNIDLVHAYLAIAHATLNNQSVAARHYRQAEPRLRALRWDDLIAWYERVSHA
jgi:hypothetical protein